MKKIVMFIVLCMLSISTYAQKDKLYEDARKFESLEMYELSITILYDLVELSSSTGELSFLHMRIGRHFLNPSVNKRMLAEWHLRKATGFLADDINSGNFTKSKSKEKMEEEIAEIFELRSMNYLKMGNQKLACRCFSDATLLHPEGSAGLNERGVKWYKENCTD